MAGKSFDDIEIMNSLMNEQNIHRRRHAEGNAKNKTINFTKRAGTFESPQAFAKRLSSSLGDARALKRLERSKRRNIDNILDFPQTGGMSHADGVGTVINLALTPLDGLFVLAAGLFVTLLTVFIQAPSGLNSMAMNTSAIHDRLHRYTGVYLAQERTLDTSNADDSTALIDASQFEALEVGQYTIQSGDTLSQIALDFGLNMDTLISFNQINDVRRMQVGSVLQIPNRDGLLHTIQEGDTLMGLAETYGSSLNSILDANTLTSAEIVPGQNIFIPGVRMDETDLKLVLGELFIYPTVGRFTSGFGYRADPFTGERRFHNGIDLANAPGTPIRAAMAGTVVHVETQIGNYGKFVIIQHPRGFQTLYGHLSRIDVVRGQYVSQNEQIGLMGTTGRSTGPHLHFSIINNGTFVDPLGYLH